MKLIDVAMYLVYIATYSIVVPVGIGLYLFKGLSTPMKVFFASLCVEFFLDMCLLLFNFKETNTFFYVYSVAHVLILSWVFLSVITNKTLRKPIMVIAFLLIVFIFIDAFFISGLTNNGFSNAVARIYILALGAYYLTELIQENTDLYLQKQPLFWVSVALVLANLVGSFDIFRDPIVSYSQTFYLQYYVFWCIVTIMMYGAFSYALLLNESD